MIAMNDYNFMQTMWHPVNESIQQDLRFLHTVSMDIQTVYHLLIPLSQLVHYSQFIHELQGCTFFWICAFQLGVSALQY